MTIKPNISIFIYSMGKGGAEKIVSTILFDLVKYFKVHLVLLSNEIVYEIPIDVKVTNLSIVSSNGFVKLLSVPINAYKYKKFCQKNKIKTSLSILTQPNFISLLSKLLGNSAKTIISEHTVLSNWRSKEVLYSMFHKFFVKKLYPIADSIVVVSKYTQYDLINNYNIRKTHIDVIYNPHNLSSIDRLKMLPILDNNFISFSSRVIISAGTLESRKGFYELIKAFSLLEYSDLNLLIMGDGPEKESLQKLVSDLNLTKRVFLLGFVDNPYQYFKNSDIFVLASHVEGLPNVIIEALACGCAVISTDCISGPREILSPGTDYPAKELIEFQDVEYGILTPVDNIHELKLAMESLIKNDSKLVKYKEKSLFRAHDFDLKQNNDYIDLLIY
jgi:N-acetylgalactosamine-N,N'-diacetylbacillosaminyl-diphospho-undecaprenol 4-alpha-N-acetylgalactosaminyltransferase